MRFRRTLTHLKLQDARIEWDAGIAAYFYCVLFGDNSTQFLDPYFQWNFVLAIAAGGGNTCSIRRNR